MLLKAAVSLETLICFTVVINRNMKLTHKCTSIFIMYFINSILTNMFGWYSGHQGEASRNFGNKIYHKYFIVLVGFIDIFFLSARKMEQHTCHYLSTLIIFIVIFVVHQTQETIRTVRSTSVAVEHDSTGIYRLAFLTIIKSRRPYTGRIFSCCTTAVTGCCGVCRCFML
jgi:hypothetical protein